MKNQIYREKSNRERPGLTERHFSLSTTLPPKKKRKRGDSLSSPKQNERGKREVEEEVEEHESEATERERAKREERRER